MKGLSPTQRTLRALREQGLICAIVEKWNPYGGPHGIRQDLFGIIDILALDPRRGVVGIQATGQDFAGHLRKLTDEKAQECLDWLRTPGTALELWAWRKVKAQRGGKALIWQPRVRVLGAEDFGDALVTGHGDQDLGPTDSLGPYPGHPEERTRKPEDLLEAASRVGTAESLSDASQAKLGAIHTGTTARSDGRVSGSETEAVR